MKIELFYTLDTVDWYEDIPESSSLAKNQYEIINDYDPLIYWDELRGDEFMRPVNKLCGTLLDCGDIGFFNTANCIKLKNWLEARLDKPTTSYQHKFYTDLLDFATRAIQYKTGVVLEF